MPANAPPARRVYLEVTNACNFRCDFCPIQVSRRRPRMMDYGLYRAGVDQIADERISPAIGFHVLGEPLLYPHIVEAVAYAGDRGLRTVLTTNGSLLAPDMVSSLADARLSVLSISLQMLDAEGHRCRESPMSFDDYRARIVDAVGRIAREGRHTEVQIVTMSTWTRSFFDVDRTMRIGANGRGFPDGLALLVHDIYRAVGREVRRDELEQAARRLNPLRPCRLRLDERVSLSILPFMDWGNAFTDRHVYPTRIGACGYLLSTIGVLSNGEVTICCGDYDGRTSLGNLRDHSLLSLLESDPARAVRNGHRQMRLVHPHCQRCFGSTNRVKAAVKGLVSLFVFRWGRLRQGSEQPETPLLPADRLPGRAMPA